jgi:hypothetical protein
MPHYIPTTPAQITTLEKVIASARTRLDGLAEEDPAGRLLREQIAEREALTRTREDNLYASNKTAMRILPFMDLLGICLVISGLTNLAARHIATGVTVLVLGALMLAWMIAATVWTWRDVREYRRIHAGEQPRQ